MFFESAESAPKVALVTQLFHVNISDDSPNILPSFVANGFLQIGSEITVDNSLQRPRLSEKDLKPTPWSTYGCVVYVAT